MTKQKKSPDPQKALENTKKPPEKKIKEIGGRINAPEPTRYGDWEKDGKCVDF